MAIYRWPAGDRGHPYPARNRRLRRLPRLGALYHQAAAAERGPVARPARRAVGIDRQQPAGRRPVRRQARHRRYRAAPVAGGRRSARRRHVRRHRRRIGRPRPRPGAAPGDRPFPRQGQVRAGLRRIAGQRRHALLRLLSRLGAGADLAAAERRLRGGRPRHRDAVPQGRPRSARRARRGRQALRVQERARHLHRTRPIRRPPARTCSSFSTASTASS